MRGVSCLRARIFHGILLYIVLCRAWPYAFRCQGGQLYFPVSVDRRVARPVRDISSIRSAFGSPCVARKDGVAS